MFKKQTHQILKKKEIKKKSLVETAPLKIKKEEAGGCCGFCHEPKEPKKEEK